MCVWDIQTYEKSGGGEAAAPLAPQQMTPLAACAVHRAFQSLG